MIQFIPAKINLGLYIVSKRPDGYHNLQTIFYPIGCLNGTPDVPYPFCDILEITPSETGNPEFIFTGNAVKCAAEDNLVVKAHHAFANKFAEISGNEMPAFRVQLEKHIPDGAGIGGGSADATYTLRTLNALTGSIFDSNALSEIAVNLGADCPCFLFDCPTYAEGIGEILSPLPHFLEGKWLLLVKPDIYISTKEAFSGISPHTPDFNLCRLPSLPVNEWRDKVSNDFEASLTPKHPEFAKIKSNLYSTGAIYASMSGSGSSFYGIFDDHQSASTALSAITTLHPDIYATLILLN